MNLDTNFFVAETDTEPIVHVLEGTYEVRLQTTYQMEYNSGDGWSAGPRYRSAPATPATLRVVELIPVIIR